jgi:predicted AAA+ superfamily ATPase
MMDNPQAFLDEVRGKRIVLDEIHRLGNPSAILKIAADYYPDTQILATGSSTLGASAKFRDTLAGRKAELWLTPMIQEDLKDFEREEIYYRLLRGGFPLSFWLKHSPSGISKSG